MLRSQVEQFNSKQGRQKLALQTSNADAAKGLEWLEENKDLFDHEIFGPPVITCSVKDPRYSNLIQGMLQEDDFFCFTTQSRQDHKKLSDRFYKEMGLTVTIRTCTSPLHNFARPMQSEEVSRLGLDGYAIDFLDGPDPVLAMLCAERRLHLSAVGLRDISEEQFDRLVGSEKLMTWAAGKQLYRVTRRREYGPGAVSTVTRDIYVGKHWTDQPVDEMEKLRLEQKLEEVDREFQALKTEVSDLKNRQEELSDTEKEINQKIVGVPRIAPVSVKAS